jgi:hypothetical protein
MSGHTHGHADVLALVRAEWEDMLVTGTASLEQVCVCVCVCVCPRVRVYNRRRVGC